MLNLKQHNHPSFTKNELVYIRELFELELEKTLSESPTMLWGDIEDAERRYDEDVTITKSIINKINVRSLQ